jgi:hypothetical protein
MEAIVAKIDLDVAFEVGPALDAYLERLLADTKVTATVINERGSGGDHLFYVAAYHAGPDGDPKFVTTLIQD